MPELFNPGTLEMSAEPLSRVPSELLWSECLPNRIAVVAALVLLVVELSDLLRLFPALLRCIPRWKGNVELEHSVSMARTRNTVALVAGVLFCIVADRFSLLEPSWRTAIPQEWRLAVTAGLLFGAVVIRRLLYLVSRFRSRTSEFACTVRHTLYNYLILFSALAVLSALLLGACGVPEASVRVVLIVESAMAYVLHLIRTGQIFASRFSVFTTILYLCGLEILPLGILILTCIR